MCPFSSSTKETPTINFVWAGPPRFDKGGQDVLATETIAANFKKFGEESSQNPMVFWCQKEHKDAYVKYFAERGIEITVKTFEEVLERSTNIHAAEVLDHYRELTKEGSPTVHYVYFKDMFFNFLLATESGYVMDTGMYADLSKPVKCEAYDTFKFPRLAAGQNEVWMQYAPKDSPDAAKFLDAYLRLYRSDIEKIKTYPEEEFRPELFQDNIGNIAVQHLNRFLSEDPSRMETNTWSCPRSAGSLLPMDECGVSKLYLNSHRKRSVPILRAAFLSEKPEIIAFLFAHGLKDDIDRIYDDRYGEGTLLTKITEKIAFEPTPERIALLAYLLEHGANPNTVYKEKTLGKITGICTPLMNAVKSKSLEAIKLLLDHGARPQDTDRKFILDACTNRSTPPEIKALLLPYLSVAAPPVLTSAAPAAPNMYPPSSSPKEIPTINFVWVGPPRFDKGGQDVLAPETIAANFKKFGKESSQNPMVFWCQKEHKDAYVKYFAERGIEITVKTIEEVLESSTNIHAAEVLEHYRELTKAGNNVLNNIFFKNMFFNFLLAAEGGYVMDTGMYAELSKPVKCEAYDTFKFPRLANPKNEVWMQYAPKGSPDAEKFLDAYLSYHSSEKKRTDFPHRFADRIATIYLDKFLSEEPSRIETNTWPCPALTPEGIPLPECGINKLYFNSHLPKVMTPTLSAFYSGKPELLAFLFAHGLKDNINRTYDNHHFEEEPTILIMISADIHIGATPEKIALLACLLEHGANPNVRYQKKSYTEITGTRTPLMDAVESRSLEAIKLLLDHGARPQDTDRKFILDACSDTSTPPEIKALLLPYLSIEAPIEAPTNTESAAPGAQRALALKEALLSIYNEGEEENPTSGPKPD
jgi:hypothetical protein